MKVKVYSTNACPWCHTAKDFLRKNNIEFEDINVETDPKAAAEMIKKSGQRGVPVLDIEGTIIVGYNEAAIKKALSIG